MKADTMVKKTVIDNERETNNGIGNPCSVSSRAVPSLSYHSRSEADREGSGSHTIDHV